VSLKTDLIRDRFQEIQSSLERLEQIGALPEETFLADQDTLDVACYRLLVAIEAALQICFHVSAKKLHRVPQEYAECFAILGKAGILSSDLSQSLGQMARFRNMLVHVYWKVDYRQVYAIINAHLDDLRAFVHAIGALL